MRTRNSANAIVASGKTYVQCEDCRGDPKAIPFCKACDASGKVQPCPVCHGGGCVGLVHHLEVCGTCKGLGWIPVHVPGKTLKKKWVGKWQ